MDIYRLSLNLNRWEGGYCLHFRAFGHLLHSVIPTHFDATNRVAEQLLEWQYCCADAAKRTSTEGSATSPFDPLLPFASKGIFVIIQGGTSVSMSRLSTFITSLPAWQVFLLICIPFFGSGFLAMPVPGQPGSVVEMDGVFSRMMLTLMPVAIILYSWIWSIGNVSDRAASENVRRPDRFFNFALPYTFAYLIFAYFFFPSPGKMGDPLVPFGLVVTLHMFAVVCTFYAIASAAMRLKSYEAGNRVGFGAAFGTFFLIWFFPFGLWFVQPRVNRASAETGAVS